MQWPGLKHGALCRDPEFSALGYRASTNLLVLVYNPRWRQGSEKIVLLNNTYTETLKQTEFLSNFLASYEALKQSIGHSNALYKNR